MGRVKRRSYASFEEAHTAAKHWLDEVSVYLDAPYWVKVPKNEKEAILECRRIFERVERMRAARLEKWGRAWLSDGERGAIEALADGGAPFEASKRAKQAGEGSPALFANTVQPADVVQVYLEAFRYFQSVLDGSHTLGVKNSSSLRQRILSDKKAFLVWFTDVHTDGAAAASDLAYSLLRFDFAELRGKLGLPKMRMPPPAPRSAPLTDADADYLQSHTRALAKHIAEQVSQAVKRSKRWPMSAHALALAVVASSDNDESTFTKARNKKGA